MAEIYFITGSYLAALELLERCLAIRKAKLGPDHEDVSDIQDDIEEVRSALTDRKPPEHKTLRICGACRKFVSTFRECTACSACWYCSEECEAAFREPHAALCERAREVRREETKRREMIAAEKKAKAAAKLKAKAVKKKGNNQKKKEGNKARKPKKKQ